MTALEKLALLKQSRMNTTGQPPSVSVTQKVVAKQRSASPRKAVSAPSTTKKESKPDTLKLDGVRSVAKVKQPTPWNYNNTWKKGEFKAGTPVIDPDGRCGVVLDNLSAQYAVQFGGGRVYFYLKANKELKLLEKDK